MSFNEKEFIEKVMLSISEFFSLEPRMKCRGGIILKSAYKDVIAFLKLKRKHQVQSVPNDFDLNHPEHNDQFDYMSFLPLVSYDQKLPHPLEDAVFLSYQPSAPPIPDSPSTDSATVGIKANNLLADFEVYNEQVEFKGMGLVDKVCVPLLERVCHVYPSLIECQRNRTPKYVGWAFMALGRVLHLLEITKVEEMNEEACECLQLLWDEVQVFGFDLSWIAPQVEFALNMKGYVEKMSEMNKLEEEKWSLGLRIQEIRMKLIELEKEMESPKGALAKLRVDLGKPVESEWLLEYQVSDLNSVQ